MFSTIQPQHYVAIRLPSDNIRIEQIIPDTQIHLGKYGSFHTNHIINQPYHLTFEVLDHSQRKDERGLRIVSANELHAETLIEEDEPDVAPGSSEDGSTATPTANTFDEFGLPATTEKSNVNIIDDPAMQKLTTEEIEALKSDGSFDPKELIAKIMASHSQIDQKTAFSLAKYTLRKQKKYLKRFTVLPIDVTMLADWLSTEKDFARVMEIRNELIGLMGSWANVYASGPVSDDEEPRNRYLVVDDTGGLIVASLAERMGILYQEPTWESEQDSKDLATNQDEAADMQAEASPSNKKYRRRQLYNHDVSKSNSLTLIHANQQPNLHLLRYFSYDPNTPVSPAEPSPHPLHTHLKALTWLQLLNPTADATYNTEPPYKSPEELAQLKSNQRSTYHRKRRRWNRCQAIVDETRNGGFDGLIVASYTDARSIVGNLVPLLRGGAQIAVYYPHIEPLLDLCDVYGTARRTAYLNLSESDKALLEDAWAWNEGENSNAHVNGHVNGTTNDDQNASAEQRKTALLGDFPVDPTLTLGFMLQTARVKRWQVLPGRTHPLMMGRGGAEGYLAVATRVLPVKGKIVSARGRNRQKPKNKGGRVENETVELDDNDISPDELENEQEAKRAKVE